MEVYPGATHHDNREAPPEGRAKHVFVSKLAVSSNGIDRALDHNRAAGMQRAVCCVMNSMIFRDS